MAQIEMVDGPMIRILSEEAGLEKMLSTEL